MANITKYPLIDWFETTLAQERDGATWLVYLNTVPEFTFPAWVTTYIVVNPGKSRMQLAEINAIDTVAKTVTVTSITVEKGAGVVYTQQSHSVWSVVRISDNFAFWDHIKTAVNSKVDRNDEDIKIYKFADATARDAELTSPVEWESAYLTSEGKWTDYVAGSRADRATGATPNASVTVAGKVELATSAEFDAWTDIWGTWASLTVLPSLIKAKNDLQDVTTANNVINIVTNTSNIAANTTDISDINVQLDFNIWSWLATDPILLSSDTEVNVPSWDYAKLKEFEVDYNGTYFITREVRKNWNDVLTRVAVNWTVVSWVFTTSSFSYVTVSYQATVTAWDLIQIEWFCWTNNWDLQNAKIRWFLLPQSAWTVVL